jgi:hypothetical protein
VSAVDVAETTIEHLDFAPDIPCTGKDGECQTPASYFVEHRCPFCGWHKDGANGTACDPCWVGRSREIRQCSACLRCYPHGDGWRIVEVLR